MQRNSKYSLIYAPGLAGYERFWQRRTLVVNGKTATLKCWFDSSGLDPDAKIWTCRQTGAVTTLTGSGSEPDFEDYAPPNNTRLLDINQGKYLNASDNIIGDITTQDIIFIIGVRPQNDGTTRMCGKLRSVPSSQGWQCYQTGANLFFRIYSGGSNVSIASASVSDDYHYLCAVTINRDENSTDGAYFYLDNNPGSGVNPSSISGTMTCDVPLEIGAALSGLPYGGGISFIALYVGDDLFSAGSTGKDEMDAVVNDICARYFGTEALHNHESPISDTTPARNSLATSQRIVFEEAGNPPRMFPVGLNWPRSETVYDPRTGLYLPSCRLEPSVQNVCLQSGDLTLTWTHLRASHTDTTSDTLPNGAPTDTDVIHEDDTAAQNHYFTQTNITTSAVPWCFSAFAKIINRRWLAMRIVLTANQIVWFDLQDGVVGPNYVGTIDRGMEYWGGGWYRCWFSFTGEDAAKPIFVYVADKAGDPGDNWPDLFDGSDQDSFFFWGAQIEQGAYPSSYVPTTTTAVTRSADSAIAWKLTPTIEQELTILIPVIIPTHTPSSDLKLFSVYKNGAAGTDHITGWADTAGKFKVTSAGSGYTSGSLVVNKVITDGDLHWLSVHAKSAELSGIVDHAYKATDSGVSIASDMDRFSLEPHGGWSGGVAIWPKFMRIQPRPPTQLLIRR